MSSYPFPEHALVKLPQIIGDPKANPPIPPVIPVSKSTWYQGIKTGRYPKPIKLGPRASAWRGKYINALIDEPFKTFE